MSVKLSRSELVLEGYRKHKLARSALRRVQNLIRGFDEDRELDLRLARFGLVVVLPLISVSFFLLFSVESLYQH
jgi:hypothetical protein